MIYRDRSPWSTMREDFRRRRLAVQEIDFEDFGDRLAFLFDELEPGTVLTITMYGKPVAEFKMTAKPPQEDLPPLGMFKDEIKIPPSFFDPLPPDLLAAFNGEGK